tara:strand:- start:904 stop:1557 length:654 start_codon:yes stop_codon:yes gene_type:complete
MELVKFERQHYIRMSDFLAGSKFTQKTFELQSDLYRMNKCKQIETIRQPDGHLYIQCKTACHFLDWYMEHSYRLHPEINQFKHEMSKFTKLVPKRVLSRSIRVELAYRQKYLCNVCQVLMKPDWEVDHIIALEDGGLDIATNLQCLCVPCHKEKTRLNRLRKSALFSEEAEAKHKMFQKPVISSDDVTVRTEDSEGSDDETMTQVFSKYFSKSDNMA